MSTFYLPYIYTLFYVLSELILHLKKKIFTPMINDIIFPGIRETKVKVRCTFTGHVHSLNKC